MPVTTIKISPSSAPIVAAGSQPVTLSVAAYDGSGVLINPAPVFTAAVLSGPGSVTVVGSSVIYAPPGAGTTAVQFAAVTASSGGVTAKTLVVVPPSIGIAGGYKTTSSYCLLADGATTFVAPIGSRPLTRIYCPSGFTGATLTPAESLDGGQTFLPLILTDGTAVSLSVVAGKGTMVNPDSFSAAGTVQFTSNLTQVGDCVFILIAG